MICDNCGQEMRDGADFCQNCGNKVQQSVSINQQLVQDNSFDSSLISQNLFTQSGVKRKRVNLKVIVPVLSVFFIGIIILVFVSATTKDSRDAKKAWETKDINRIIRLCNSENFDSTDILYNYIVNATNKLNNDFTYKVSKDGDPNEAVFEYVKNQWGTIFLSRDNEESMLYNIDYFAPALKDFNAIMSSKIYYFEALTEMLNADDKDDYLSVSSDLLKVLPKDKNYSQVSVKVGEAISAYMDNVNKLADEYVAKGDFNGAVKILEDALETLILMGQKITVRILPTKLPRLKFLMPHSMHKKQKNF